jgi:hypothetical protein
MKLIECFVSETGVSCLSRNINTIFGPEYVYGYLFFRLYEYILKDIINKNKNKNTSSNLLHELTPRIDFS